MIRTPLFPLRQQADWALPVRVHRTAIFNSSDDWCETGWHAAQFQLSSGIRLPISIWIPG